MNKVILDSNFLVAFVDRLDTFHNRAKEIADKMAKRNIESVIFDCVVNEAISVICRRLREKGRIRDLERFLETISWFAPKEEIVWLSTATNIFYDEIIEVIKKTKGELNFHDALIIVGAREMGVYNIISFDEDFDTIRWLKRIGSEKQID